MGIADVEQAMQPLYTSRPEEERSGMGFTMMQAFMDKLSVESKPGCGTKVVMCKSFRVPQDDATNPEPDSSGQTGGHEEP